MLTIFDRENRWLGYASPLMLSNSNKLPVAVDDSLSIEQGSGPVSVSVLANDFDPEGQPLNLISANAALGTAVAEPDNTVTYTPPVGITGFDTVLYEIADDIGQTRTGQINVTISEPSLTISVSANSTMVVNATTGLVDVTITQPAAFAGTYQVDPVDVLTGPLPLVPPSISGSPVEGQLLTATPGLWIFEVSETEPVSNCQWQVGGVDVSGETNGTYTIQTGDLALGITVRETLSDSNGQRFSVSSAVDDSAGAFAPSDDTGLIGWWDAADAATLTETSGSVSAWADKAGGAALTQSTGATQPTTGSRTLNGLNVVDFDGSQYLEALRSLPVSGDVAFHMAVVIDTADNVYDALISADATNDFQFDAASEPSFSGRLNVSGIGSSLDVTGGPYSDGIILSVVFDQTSAGQAEVFIGNASRGTMAYTTALDSSQTLRVMANRAANHSSDGACAEVIVTSNLSNRTDYHNYLATKWGLA